MKRFHVHLGVSDLDASIGFYSKLFGVAPSVRKDDYAKWMLDDPRVNFAISDRGARNGLNHLGLQADSADELADIGLRFAAGGRTECALLLRGVRQALGTGPAGHSVGSVSQPRFHPRVRCRSAP